MKSLFTVSGVVFAHICVFLLLANGCRGTSSESNTWKNADTSVYSGGARSARPAPAKAVPAAAEPAGPAQGVPAKAEPAEPAPAKATPASSGKSAPAPAAAAAAGEETVYVVKKGDYLSTIGLRHGVTAKEIADANGIGLNDMIFEGQKLKIPAAKPKASAEKTAAAEGEIYVVKKGDVLGGIALKHKVTVAQIKEANGLKSDVIRVGQKLVIPTKAKPAEKKDAAPAEAEKQPATSAPAPAAAPEKPATATTQPADGNAAAKDGGNAGSATPVDDNFGMPEGGFGALDEEGGESASAPQRAEGPAEAVPATGTSAE